MKSVVKVAYKILSESNVYDAYLTLRNFIVSIVVDETIFHPQVRSVKNGIVCW